ncbi:phage Gp37/Gp68 family protein [candidate division KSB1 bacterium]|nr:phage Gp37/Gp68 family protein [candidate division KSB1 bacterium]
MKRTKIEWTESTWNPTSGCSKLSIGCKNCYAERMAKRLQAIGLEKYKNGFELTLHPDKLQEPYNWKNPRTVFVNSMSDLFHENIPVKFIENVFIVMNENLRHTFQVLTKRAGILLQYSDNLTWSNNIWMGVTVESQQYVNRIDKLRQTGAKVKFLSLEPLLSQIKNLDLKDIDWVIVGGESGPGARPMLKKWVLEIKEQCQSQNVPFFFKQWGGINKKKAGRILAGRTWDETPVIP